MPCNKLPYSPNTSRPALRQVLSRIYAKFFNKPDSTHAPSESSLSFHSLGFELLFSWSSSFTTVTSRVRHLKMDSRDSAVKSGGTNVSKSVARSQMDAISFTPLSRTFAKTWRIRQDCRKFFDKFPRPKSLVVVVPSLEIPNHYFGESALESPFNAGVNATYEYLRRSFIVVYAHLRPFVKHNVA